MSWGVRAVTVRFGARVALDGVTLSAPTGTVTAVVGGDGAGKSTLLRVLVGGRRPDTGTVHRPDRRQIGYFPGAAGVYPDLSVAENVDFAAQAYRARDRQRRARLLAAAGLAGVPDRLAGQLSGGMRQKLGLVMAMLHEPQLLVLDEPSTGVDPVSRAELTWLVNRAAAAGTAVVMSTAYLDEAERASQVLVLDRGRVLRSGEPEAVVNDLPGRVVHTRQRPETELAWRRGDGWQLWLPPGATAPAPADATPVRPDLEDAVIVAALERSAS